MSKVMLVDDNSSHLTLVKYILSSKGENLEITTCESGEEALTLLQCGHFFDVIISDYEMGNGLNGLQLMEKIKEFYPQIPFILLTGQGNEAVAAEALKKGASDYFTKEIGFVHYERLINSICQTIEKSRCQKELKQKIKDLEETGRFYRFLLDSSPDGLGIIQDNCFTYVNKKLTEILGLSEENILHQPVTNIFNQEITSYLQKIHSAKEKLSPCISKQKNQLTGEITDLEITADNYPYKEKMILKFSLKSLDKHEKELLVEYSADNSL